ncbi:MAG: hypothetical protein IKW28_00715 [Lachnospiraceae bacterium]|nr:hypothetical protein [Lachnospiraceae bacterium]
MNGGMGVVKTRTEAKEFIASMSDVDFAKVCEYLNTKFFLKSENKKACEERFIKEVKKAEESIEQGHFVTSKELHEFLGI